MGFKLLTNTKKKEILSRIISDERKKPHKKKYVLDELSCQAGVLTLYGDFFLRYPNMKYCERKVTIKDLLEYELIKKPTNNYYDELDLMTGGERTVKRTIEYLRKYPEINSIPVKYIRDWVKERLKHTNKTYTKDRDKLVQAIKLKESKTMMIVDGNHRVFEEIKNYIINKELAKFDLIELKPVLRRSS